MKTARIYESLRTATIEGRDAISLLDDLGTELGCRLEVLDVATWRNSFAPAHCLPRPARTVLRETLERCAGHLPAILRLDLGGQTALAVPVPSRRPAALLASRFTDAVPELSVLQHVSTVAALELEKLAAERDSLSRAGAELLGGLLTGRPDADALGSELRGAGLVGPLVVATWSALSGNDGSLHQELYARAVPHLLRSGDDDRLPLALIGDEARSRRLLVQALGAGRAVGLSGAVTTPEAIPHAARAARWAWHGTTDDLRIVRYGEDEPPAWGFALEQSEELVDHVLGRLLEYDRDHHTELVRTLAALLRNNRSPSPTAAELFIHRQTLVYRVRRIEDLTDRHVARTKDVVDLWLAMRALEVIEGTSLLGA
jgi:purine catabolism regulator